VNEFIVIFILNLLLHTLRHLKWHLKVISHGLKYVSLYLPKEVVFQGLGTTIFSLMIKREIAKNTSLETHLKLKDSDRLENQRREQRSQRREVKSVSSEKLRQITSTKCNVVYLIGHPPRIAVSNTRNRSSNTCGCTCRCCRCCRCCCCLTLFALNSVLFSSPMAVKLCGTRRIQFSINYI